MKELSLEEMEAILHEHEIRELAQDIEGTMETVAPNPFYEFPSAGWRVDGVEGVREHYRRSLPHGGKSNIASKKRVHGVGPNTLFREAWVSWDSEDGERLTGQYLAVLEFDPVTRKIVSERQYSDASFDRFLDHHVGPDYGDTPGVTRLNANAKPISREDMLAEIRGDDGATPRELSRGEMEDILFEHEKAELEYDLDGTMATLVPNPHFELCFMGLAVDGPDAVREMYSRMLVRGGEGRNLQADARIVSVQKNHIIREALISFDGDDGNRRTGLYNVVVEFDPVLKKIKGERMYGDLTYGQFMSKIIGEDIATVPGVSRIADTLPVVNVHDAFAAAAARGITINNPRVQL